MGMSILQRQQYSSFTTHPTASSSPSHTNPANSLCPSSTLQSKARHPHPRRHRRRDRECARGLKATGILAVSQEPATSLPADRAHNTAALAPRLRPIRDAILDHTRGFHQLLMTAEGSALEECSDSPAPPIERNDDLGRPVRALVRIRDRVLTEAEGARMTARNPRWRI